MVAKCPDCGEPIQRCTCEDPHTKRMERIVVALERIAAALEKSAMLAEPIHIIPAEDVEAAMLKPGTIIRVDGP